MRKRYVLLVLTAVVLTGLLAWSTQRMNARVISEIQLHPSSERALETMVMTLADGTVYPVNYLREGDSVFVGNDGFWWRAFRGEGQRVEMLIQGQRFVGNAKVELDDQAYIDDIFARLRPKVPDWLPDWLNGKLVVITLDTNVSGAIDQEDS